MKEENNVPLPPGLDWENMKDGIFDKVHSLEQIESIQKNKKDSRRRSWLFFLIFILLIIAVMGLYQKATNNQLPEARDVVKLPENSNNMEVIAPTNHGNSAATSDVVRSINRSAKKNLEDNPNNPDLAIEGLGPDMESKKSVGSQMEINQLSASKHLNENDALSDELNLDSHSTPNGSFNLKETNSIQPNHTIEQSNVTPIAGIEPSSVLPKIAELQPLQKSAFDQLEYKDVNLSLFDFQRMNGEEGPDISRSRSSNQFILEGGITFWNEGYGNNKPERDQYETPLASFQLQGHYIRNFKGNYFVMAGIQFQQLENRFEYNNTIPDYKVILKDTIVQVQRNLVTGEQNVIYGDVEQFVQAERRIKHYNQSRLFKASLALGKSWRFKSFQTDIYLGGGLNVLVHNQGRTLFNETILDYNGTSNSLYQNQGAIDGMVGARFHYFLSQNIGIATGFQAQKSLMNWSAQNGTSFYPMTFSLQVGLSYSLY